MLVVWSVNRPTCCAEREVIIRYGTDRQRYVGEGMGSGLNRGFVPCRGSNQWDIETKAGIGISLSRFAAKSQCCAVLLTLRFSSVKFKR